MRLIFAVLALAMLACGVQTQLPRSVNMESHIDTEYPKAYRVTVPSNIRDAPDGKIVRHKKPGEFIIVYQELDGWCRITTDGAKPLWIWCDLLER